MHNLRVGTRAIDIADITINQRERLSMGEPREREVERMIRERRERGERQRVRVQRRCRESRLRRVSQASEQ